MNNQLKTVRERVAALLGDLDDKLSPTDQAWGPAAFLLASFLIGCDPHAIAEELEMDPVAVGVFAERARAAGIWKDGALQDEHWLSGDDDSGVAFWLDVSVVHGHLSRSGDRYSMTDEGMRHVEGMLAR